ncbi:Rieske (2Fe-2S) protein [Methyloversatilis discipulorum]|uniref:Rieske (2Fe-2S) protein n=1 Tax=Methyloversatilis discipulorum TaxID=1119528 RepID=UPI001A5EB0C4|nr:Rieske 2Fe-2S domain-containing protein [Methyloversatilis discipulorum]MBL8468916.1 Rieske 2Fe-2S domain-containing protein [Methyloversatilis discipulorum]
MSRVSVCASDALEEGGAGVRFEIAGAGGKPRQAFAVRFHGRVHGYINSCRHVPIELDWNHGEFFDTSKIYLICSTHGALYAPDTGLCVGGPCRGARLEPVKLEESDGQVWLSEARSE